jgi:hypothetical protein
MFWKTEEPGEYEVEVTGRYQGTDLGMARARFMTYRDNSEVLNRSANHSLLQQLATATGGTHQLHGGLKKLLEDLKPESTTRTAKLHKFPAWDEANPWLNTVLFLVFVGLVSGEWLLRRLWGLV